MPRHAGPHIALRAWGSQASLMTNLQELEGSFVLLLGRRMFLEQVRVDELVQLSELCLQIHFAVSTAGAAVYSPTQACRATILTNFITDHVEIWKMGGGGGGGDLMSRPHLRHALHVAGSRHLHLA